MHSDSIKSQIINRLTMEKKGQLVFPNDFLNIGSPIAVNTCFSRLADEKMLIRLGKGIYLFPRKNSSGGITYPSLEYVAQEVAVREKVRIRPTGSYAMNKLGLSTQVPTKVVFLTDGSPRKIRVGGGTITFRKTTPKKLAVENELVFLVIQALQAVEKKGATSYILQILSDALKAESPESIRGGAKSAPVWIAKILYSFADKIEKGD
jgi:hypothetical protein